MKRSIKVSAPLLASVAVAVMSTGCRHVEPQRCVDENNKVVDQSFCTGQPLSSDNRNTGNMGNARGGSGFHPYHYYYGGLGGYALGALASGGSTTPVSGHSYSTSSSSRGGFGSSFGGAGSSGGSSGSHGGGAGE